MLNLKPCPCCGRHSAHLSYDTIWGYKVVCYCCNIQSDWHFELHRAVKIWNTRVTYEEFYRQIIIGDDNE